MGWFNPSFGDRAACQLANVIKAEACVFTIEKSYRIVDCKRCGEESCGLVAVVPPSKAFPVKVSDAWVLKNTRMPVSAIFENIEAGSSVDDILEWFWGLDRAQVEQVIEFATRSLDRPPSYAP